MKPCTWSWLLLVPALAAAAPTPGAPAWEGTYTFEESAPGYAWTYTVEVTSLPPAYSAHVTVNGNQTYIDIHCDARPRGSDMLDIYFREKANEDSSDFEEGEHVLSLKRVPGGKPQFVWAGLQPQLEPTPDPSTLPQSIGDASSYVTQYPEKFLQVREVDTRLKKLLGAAFDTFDANISTQSPIREESGFLVLTGMFPHSGGEQAACLVYDPKANAIHVAVLGAEDGRLDVYSEAPASLPDWLKDPSSKQFPLYVPESAREALKIVVHD